MEPGVRARVAAAVLLAGAVWVYFGEKEPLIAGVMLVAGVVLAVAIPTRRDRPNELLEAALQGTQEAFDELIEALGLEGDPIYVPLGPGRPVRMFIPAKKGDVVVPRLDEDTVLVRQGPGTLGVAVKAPEMPWPAEWKAAGASDGSVKAVVYRLQQMARARGQVAHVTVEGNGDRTRIMITQKDPLRPDVFTPTAAALAAHALGRPLRLIPRHPAKGYTCLTLMPSPMAQG